MVAIAVAIIRQRTGNFDPSTYRDRYREALQQLIEAKMKGLTIKLECLGVPRWHRELGNLGQLSACPVVKRGVERWQLLDRIRQHRRCPAPRRRVRGWRCVSALPHGFNSSKLAAGRAEYRVIGQLVRISRSIGDRLALQNDDCASYPRTLVPTHHWQVRVWQAVIQRCLSERRGCADTRPCDPRPDTGGGTTLSADRPGRDAIPALRLRWWPMASELSLFDGIQMRDLSHSTRPGADQKPVGD